MWSRCSVQSRHGRAASGPATSGEAVVAAPCVTDRLRARPLPQRPDRLRRRDARDGLDQRADPGPGEAEVAVPSARLHDEQPCVDEAREMVAGRCGDHDSILCTVASTAVETSV